MFRVKSKTSTRTAAWGRGNCGGIPPEAFDDGLKRRSGRIAFRDCSMFLPGVMARVISHSWCTDLKSRWENQMNRGEEFEDTAEGFENALGPFSRLKHRWCNMQTQLAGSMETCTNIHQDLGKTGRRPMH